MRLTPAHFIAVLWLASSLSAHAAPKAAKSPKRKPAEAPITETEVNDIKLSLVNDDGKAIKIYSVPREESERILFFRLMIDPRHADLK